ncbi:molybdenum cofactor guanylyltransferase [Halorhodospira halophila]|nr:molybdenum cofactor guanylyltransferase [Halorhodospira halophila]
MGARDKGLVPLAGRPLVAHVLDRLAPQVGAVRINANRHAARYRALGVPVDGDCHPGGLGPLAGIASALAHARSERVLVVPCDAPLLPGDMAPRLTAALEAAGADGAVARLGGRLQPVYALLHRGLAADLDAALAAGERRVHAWLGRHRVAAADFDDRSAAMVNVNTPEDLAQVAQRLSAGPG